MNVEYVLTIFYIALGVGGGVLLFRTLKSRPVGFGPKFKKALFAVMGAFFLWIGMWGGTDRIQMFTGIELWPWNWFGTDFTTYESTYLPFDFDGRGVPHLYWQDNNTLVFTGIEPPEPMSMDDFASRQVKIIIWKIDGPERAITPDQNWTGALCADRDEIRYSVYDDWTSRDRTVIGQYVNLPDHGEFAPFDAQQLSCMTGNTTACKSGGGHHLQCGFINRPEMFDHYWNPLNDNRSYVDFGPRVFFEDGKSNPVLHAPDNETPITLPIPGAEVSDSYWIYAPFEEAYLTWKWGMLNVDGLKYWAETDCWPLWWVWPDGRTKRECLPSGSMMGNVIGQFTPTLEGVFFPVFRTEDAGGYLLKDGRTERLVRGAVKMPAASADGCRIAFTYANGVSGRGRHVRVIDFCAE